MEQDVLKSIIAKILTKLTANSMMVVHPRPIPTGISNRHVHLSREDLDTLFGKGYELTVHQSISQPGQFAAVETVNLAGPKGCIEKVRVLGPVRKQTQVEIMRSDKYKLGIYPPVRESGDLKNSEGITIIGPKGSVRINEGVIISKRHIHMTPKDAQDYGVSDGEIVRVYVGNGRRLIFDQTVVRVSETAALAFHIDLDEANAAEVENGDPANIVFLRDWLESTSKEANIPETLLHKETEQEALLLVTEENVRQAGMGKKTLTVKKGAVITPLARDAIKELGVKVITV